MTLKRTVQTSKFVEFCIQQQTFTIYLDFPAVINSLCDMLKHGRVDMLPSGQNISVAALAIEILGNFDIEKDCEESYNNFKENVLNLFNGVAPPTTDNDSNPSTK